MHFIFQPHFLNGMLCFLNSLWHIVKRNFRCLTERTFIYANQSANGILSDKDIVKIKQSCVRTLAQYIKGQFPVMDYIPKTIILYFIVHSIMSILLHNMDALISYATCEWPEMYRFQ